jgi:hypothetical protein
MTLRLMLCAFILLALGGCHIPRRWNDGSDLAPHRPRHRDRQGPPGLHRLLRRMGCWSHLRDPAVRRFWSLSVNGPMTRSDRVATLEEAKAQFQKSWDAWKAWAKLEEVE